MSVIPDDICRVAFTAAGAFYHDFWIRDELANAIGDLLHAERERCEVITKGFPGLLYAIRNPHSPSPPSPTANPAPVDPSLQAPAHSTGEQP